MDIAPLLVLSSSLVIALASHHPQSLQGYSTDIECYERVAVGKKLNHSAVSTSLSLDSVRRCEQECERARCYAFSFGISHSGNGTCQIAENVPKSESVIGDIEYDLFYKNMACINKISCYKRMAIGRSLIDRLVRRSLLCDSLRACEEACQGERAFQCEGFNFKFDPKGVDNKCQLTDVKSHKLDLTRDFNPDVDFDFYDRDLNGPRQCFRGPGFDQGRPGGIPPMGGYPGSGPGDPGYPGLGEEPPGPAYPGGGGRGPPGFPARPPHHQGEDGWRFPSGRPDYPQDYPDGGGFRPPFEPGNALGPPSYPDRHEYGGGAYPLGGSGGGLPDECFLRSRTGFRLDRRVVLVSLTAPSLYDCESMCVNERKFKCNVFSFRYAVNPSVPNHNCHLGEKPYTELDPYQDIQPDRDFDVYERNPSGAQGCQPKRSYGSECFERVRSGLKLNKNLVKVALKCTSLKECEYACINMPYFTCRAFSFRYGPPVIGESDDNCLLTDWPVPEMNAGKHLSEDPECELYHRGSYGHGCEIDRYPNRGQLPDRPGRPDLPGYPGGPIAPGFQGPNRPGFPVRPEVGRPEGPVGRPEGPIGRPLPRPDDNYPGNEIPSTYHPPGKPPQGFYPQKPNSYLPPPPPRPQAPGGYLPPEKPGGFGPPPPPQPGPPPDQGYPGQKPEGGLYPTKHGHGYLPPPQRPDSYYPPPRKPDGYLPPPRKPDKYPPPPRKPDGYLPPPRNPDGYLPPPRKPDGYLPPPRKPDEYLPPKKPDYPYRPERPESPCCPLPPPGQNSYLPPPKQNPGDYPGSQGSVVGGGGGGGGGVYGFGHGYGSDSGYGSGHGNGYGSGHGSGQRPPETYLPPGSYGVTHQGRPSSSDQLCYVRYSNPARLLPQSIKNSLWVPGEVECKDECTRAREKTKFRCATLSYRDGQCELSDVEQRDLRPGYDYLHDNNDFWMFTWDFGAPGCYKPPPPGKIPQLSSPHYLGDRGVEDTWSRFTVNGQPCVAGTVCSQNKEIGVWTCPVASGDWDYCCRAGHQCGYSEGYDYPWCYVGDAGADQWRPCSDTYTPYAHSGRKAHWPVAYLHREGPPNVTLTHKPSIVESFLKSLEKAGLTTAAPESRSQAAEEEEGAMDKLLKWGKTALANLTSTTAMEPATSLSTPGTTLTTLLPTTMADMTNTTDAQLTTTTTNSTS